MLGFAGETLMEVRVFRGGGEDEPPPHPALSAMPNNTSPWIPETKARLIRSMSLLAP